MLSRVDTMLYILGGYDGYDCLKDVERIDFTKDPPHFEKLKNLTSPVKNGTSFLNPRDGLIYIVGGWDEKETLDKIFSYNPHT